MIKLDGYDDAILGPAYVWHDGAYCLHPRVIGLSLLPLVLMVALSWLLGYLYWDGAIALVRTGLDASSWLDTVWRWLEGVGLPDLKAVVAPLVVIFLITPVVVVVCLVLVSWLMTPALSRMVAQRRFAGLELKHGGSLLAGLGWTLWSVLLALGGLVDHLAHVVGAAFGHVVARLDLGLVDLPHHGF